MQTYVGGGRFGSSVDTYATLVKISAMDAEGVRMIVTLQALVAWIAILGMGGIGRLPHAGAHNEITRDSYFLIGR
jgi:hypothetical protein